MIEIAAGVIGFASGIALTAWLMKRNRTQNKNWSKGYRILGNSEKPYKPTVQNTYRSSNTNKDYSSSEDKDPPTIPNWF